MLRILAAIRQEVQAKRKVQRSIERLEDAVSVLGSENPTIHWPIHWLYDSDTEEAVPSDINEDGVVNHLDFVILSNNWLNSDQIPQ